ncbi:hypothetical protein J8273_6259 [Carpediemonas membranifera]|uniref:Uncharacterized protein n=1 Tax=Carpediemonas membranifera TaxID=201153 RepID=A0A8J6B7B3_9EUKA|nr:hypothetical protein J8273_6259 [Carpediemonas membranifera]|eukprot:KAG9391497.1 hypothetical protein J8273_6259 [Carpediemonas membranifera]
MLQYPNDEPKYSQQRAPQKTRGPRTLRSLQLSDLEPIDVLEPEDTLDAHSSSQSIPKRHADTGVYDRAVKWKAQKDKEREKKREEYMSAETAECSFAPTIGATPKTVIVKSADVVNRLFNGSQERRRQAYERIEAETEAEFESSHPFNPTLITDNSTVAPRYAQTQDTRSPMPSDLECTFEPGLVSKQMRGDTLDLYLAEPVHERLSRIRPKSAVIDSELSVTRSKSRPRSAAADRAFDAFITRQRQATQRQTAKIKALDRRLHQYSFEPETNVHSQAITPKSSQAERAKGNLERRHQRMERAQRTPVENTAPRINARSRRMRAKTAEELCYGDQERAQLARERARVVQERKQLDGVTFKPILQSQRPAGDHVSIIERTQCDVRRRERRLKKARAAELEKELENCSFRPKTIECPQFISRIASGTRGPGR